jgi:hypothetical protein
VVLKICRNVNDNAESTDLIVFYEAIFLLDNTHSEAHSKAVRLWFAVFLRLKFYIRALTATRIEGLVVQG